MRVDDKADARDLLSAAIRDFGLLYTLGLRLTLNGHSLAFESINEMARNGTCYQTLALVNDALAGGSNIMKALTASGPAEDDEDDHFQRVHDESDSAKGEMIDSAADNKGDKTLKNVRQRLFEDRSEL